MLAQVGSASVAGVESHAVSVEVNISVGLPSFVVVGLPHGAVREGRERVTAALSNVDHPVPHRRITVNLAPADVPKEGSAFDLPIAVAVLIGMGVVPQERVDGLCLVGELGLDGRLRPIRGGLPIAAGCRARGLKKLLLPRANAREAGAVEGVEVLGGESLGEVLEHLSGGNTIGPTRLDTHGLLERPPARQPDLSDVRGQQFAKRALEIAAAGGHNLLLIGPPGSGKTMMARRLPGILPPLTVAESIDVTKIHSVAGLVPAGGTLVAERPFRAPHHTASDAGLVGGGAIPRPGEVSLAHNGVLFLDELPEYRRSVLEALRQPMEDGVVSHSRARSTLTYPARFMLAAAMNPCACGLHGAEGDRCTCDPAAVARYRSRVSGPLLDRIDLHIEVPSVPVEDLRAVGSAEPSGAVRARVAAARERQNQRFHRVPGVGANSHMSSREIRRWCPLDDAAARILRQAMTRLTLSARAHDRVLKVARTIADLERADRLNSHHVGEAIQYRLLDRSRVT
jgi:magnesium chelatase family protein